VKRIALVAALGLLGIGAALAGFAIVKHENPMTAIGQAFIPSPQQVFGKSNLLVLVEGLDYDYTSNDEEYSANSRSDVIWAVNLDFTGKKIYELSIPRDMVATMPDGSQAKINQAQSEGGVREAERVISQWLGIPGFDRYMVLRIDATKDFINALGGVDVDVKSSDCLRYGTECTGGSLNYDDSWGHLHVHLKEGLQHLDGDRAVGYMRFRHDWCSDPCRIMRQQQVLHALAAKLSGDKVNTLAHVGDLMHVFRKDVQTDFSDSELIALASYFAGIGKSAIETAQVPYAGTVELPGYGDSLVPDTQARAQLVQTMLIAPPTPEPSPDAMALAAIVPSAVRVDVENGTQIPGAAHRIAQLLHKAGFTIEEVGDATRSDYRTTQIREHSDIAFAGAKVRAALPQALQREASVVPEALPSQSASQTSDVTVIVGNDLATATTPASAQRPQ
jgi:LCP family protein required for cell wall assembly